jgi:uncharacterized cupin superfamily protein
MTESFVRNAADAYAFEHPIAGVKLHFAPPDAFRDTGINIVVLQPGQPSCKYHSESVQEDFLVLGGTPLLLLEGEERPLRPWDFVHCEPGAAHVFVGAGDGPSWILQIGARREGATIDFPVSALAARYNASTPEPADDGDVAYSDWPQEDRPVTPPWPPVS